MDPIKNRDELMGSIMVGIFRSTCDNHCVTPNNGQ